VEDRGQLEHQVQHCFRVWRSRLAVGLVGEHAGRFGDQRARQRRALAFAPESSPGVCVMRAQANALQNRRRLPGTCWSRRADEQRHRHVLQRSEFRQKVVETGRQSRVRGCAVFPFLSRSTSPAVAEHGTFSRARSVEPPSRCSSVLLARTRRADRSPPFHHVRHRCRYPTTPGRVLALAGRSSAGRGRENDLLIAQGFGRIHTHARRLG